MPFGLKNAGKTFQRFIHEVVQKIKDAFVYSDDVLVASSDIESRLETVDLLLTRLIENGLRVNLTKCKWLQATVDFLGFEISSEGIQPLDSPKLLMLSNKLSLNFSAQLLQCSRVELISFILVYDADHF